MKSFIKKITGIDKIEKARAEAERVRLEEEQYAEKARNEAADARKLEREAKKAAKEAAELAKLSPKEIATRKGEAWFDVIETHVDLQNMSHGFFELDWNDLFINLLKVEGYGAEGDPEEEIVDRWFRQMCYNVAAETGVDMSSRSAGFINVKPLADNKSEIS